MPNSIKYSTSAQTLALKKGNYWIGTGDVGKGPTSTTDYWNGITPPSGGYTIYLNKASGGPSIYTAANDSQLISLSNTIAGQTFATAAAALAWFATQTDKMVFNSDYPAIVTNGLVLNLDAGFTPSYPTTGTTWYDLSSNANNGTLNNGPTFSSTVGGSIIFDGVDDHVVENLVDLSSTNAVSVDMWVKLLSYPEVSGSAKNVLEFSTNFNNVSTGFVVGYADDSNPLFQGTYPISVSLNGNAGYNISGFNKNLVNDLNWHHWVCIFDKSVTGTSPQETFLYIDGTYRNPSVVPGSPYRSDNSNNFGNLPFYYGGRSGVSYNGNSQLSQIRIYNRALTAAEVLQNYNATKSRFGL